LKPYGLAEGRFVKITISDSGPGIDESICEKIFDPFFTTKDVGKGTGLGLSSAYGIIKGHKGIIKVESVKGKGATFVIYIPASDRRIDTEAEGSGKIIKGASETILLVDDEKIVLDVGKEMLEKIGHKVLTARCGEDAVNIIKKAFEKNREADCNINKTKDVVSDFPRPDLVILDLVMPDMDGERTFDIIKNINPELKVLLASGYDEESKAANLLERGCDGFIQKPFKIDGLSMKLRDILA